MQAMATTSSTIPVETKKAPTKSRSKPRDPTECPMFLKKTYYMVDTCEPDVACWSEDGLTFVVKDPDVFEQKIIPQYFKHSKFSSFVRQLNFYGFRKIKYNDSIRIDPKVEAETANFWRFKHDKFIRGRPELLIEIRRMNSSSAAAIEREEQQEPRPVPQQNSDTLQTEVTTLKERLTAMSQTIEELTALVKNVALDKDNAVDTGNKRKKTEGIIPDQESVRSSNIEIVAAVPSLPILPAAKVEQDDISFTPGTIFPVEDGRSRQQSNGSSGTVSDQEFVEEFLSALPGDDMEFDSTDIDLGMPPLLPVTPPPISETTDEPDAPDPHMMKKLSNALKLLPKDMQELLVEKLVTNITNGVKEVAGFQSSIMSPFPASPKNKDYQTDPVPLIPVHA